MADVVRLVRPRYVVVENVAALLADTVAFGWLLGDLATLGFDAQWSVLSACAVGAPHVRERLFLVANANRVDGPQRVGTRRETTVQEGHRNAGPWSHPVDGLMEAASRGHRMAHGVPDPLEPARIRALGNAVVPQVAENIGRLITTHR
jgi:DNA (cytosine-5)-methyltransferase 1